MARSRRSLRTFSPNAVRQSIAVTALIGPIGTREYSPYVLIHHEVRCVHEVYERLAEAYDWEAEPKEAARAALASLREPTREVSSAGIASDQWQAAIDAMLAAIDADDAAELAAHAEDRVARWPPVQAKLEQLGGAVWQSEQDPRGWRVEVGNLEVSLDLGTGEVLVDGEPPDFDWSLENMPANVERYLREREQRKANEARKRELRKTHRWVNGRGWVPKSGEGPVIRRRG